MFITLNSILQSVNYYSFPNYLNCSKSEIIYQR